MGFRALPTYGRICGGSFGGFYAETKVPLRGLFQGFYRGVTKGLRVLGFVVMSSSASHASSFVSDWWGLG